MDDNRKTKQDLIEELKALRQQIQVYDAFYTESLSGIIRDSVDGVLIVDLEGLVLFGNPAAERILKRENGELQGTHLGHSDP